MVVIANSRFVSLRLRVVVVSACYRIGFIAGFSILALFITSQHIRQETVYLSNHNADSESSVFSTNKNTGYKVNHLNTSAKLNSTYHVIKSMPNPICKEKKTNVAFLKVHKAGSTTVMNIFLRYAVGNDLNIVLPKRWQGNGFNYLGYGKTLSRKNIVPLPSNETYNILCNHVIYDKNAFDDVMPPDSTYIGIIRDPASHFISASVYYGFYRSLKNVLFHRNKLNFKDFNAKNENVLSEFLKNPGDFRNVSTAFVRNRMSYDFGVNPLLFNNKNFIDYHLKQLDKDFKLVMIMEYFHESLILLKRILCWELKDILYVPLNINSRKIDLSLSTDDLQRLKRWNYADFRLYNHFNNTFWKRVEKEGATFHEEVNHFKEVQKKVTVFCLNLDQSRFFFVEKSRWNNNFTVVREDCVFMTLKELPLIKHLIISAWGKYYSWLGYQVKDKTSSQTTTNTAMNINLAHVPFVIQT
ncbi:hypothetical protein KUTeg_024302 [Tegillarca granosa]|uniref:Uncharacterized protein n=1 Tax=Tegillarca granosa TaxID=220873 RepID=A0ABQ9DWY7_TEGGR|nr:hypothetical protein KUTeg_024302 [Tegillarca granosa]